MDSQTVYDVLLFLHIALVIVTFMIAGLLRVAQAALPKAGSLGVFGSWAMAMGRGSRTIPWAILAVLVAGGALLGTAPADDDFSWGSSWVVVSVAAVVVLMGLSGAVMTPWGRGVADELQAAIAASGPGAPVTPSLRGAALAPRAWIVGHTLTGGFLGVVFLMAVKPGWTWSVVAVVVAAAIGAADGRWELGRAATRTAMATA
ncbi:MAG: hypothetical protein GC157_11075 [Frankiales bacterium]|nr:hypothetical protein [Frankiales bacterium]